MKLLWLNDLMHFLARSRNCDNSAGYCFFWVILQAIKQLNNKKNAIKKRFKFHFLISITINLTVLTRIVVLIVRHFVIGLCNHISANSFF